MFSNRCKSEDMFILTDIINAEFVVEDLFRYKTRACFLHTKSLPGRPGKR